MAKKLRTFTINATITIQCGHSIKAASLEDAIGQSRDLKETDFIEVFEDFNDGSLNVTGVFET